jgi:hypothetical protein
MGLRVGMLWGVNDVWTLLACKVGRFVDAALTLVSA